MGILKLFGRTYNLADPVEVDHIASEAVAEALKTSPTLEQRVLAAGATITTTPIGPGSVITAADTSTTDYHLNIAAQMATKLSDRKKRIEIEDHEACIAYERDALERRTAHEEARRLRREEIAELSRNIEFYSMAPAILKPVAGKVGERSSAADIAAVAKAAHIKKPGAVARKGNGTIPPVTARRNAFTVPEGYEAVRDAEGRATGKVRPILPLNGGTAPGAAQT